jgi:uncharacterized protein (TIGR02996 family)
MPPALFDILLQTVRETPADDAPRLVLADWCMDQDDPALQARGEHLHLQVQLDHLEEHDRRRDALAERERQLRNRYQTAWLGPLAAFETTWRRGMLELALDADKLDDQALAVLNEAREARWLTGLTVRAVVPQSGQVLAGWPWLARLTDLRLLPRQGGQWWAGQHGLGDAGAEALARSRWLPRLGALALPRNNLSAAGFRALVRTVLLDRLTELDLARNDLGDEGARALAGSPRLAGLRKLDLGANHVGDPGGLALAESAYLGNLEHLHLGGNHLGVVSAQALAAADWPGRLRTLDLSDSPIGIRGVRALAGSPALAGLSTLELNRTGAGDSGALGLAAARHLHGLRVLGLAANNIYHEGALALADARHLRRLRLLRLESNLIGRTAAAALRMLFDDRVVF